MCFLNQSATLVKLPYQLAKSYYTNNVPRNLRGLQRVISLSRVSLVEWLCFCPVLFSPREPNWQSSLYLDYTFRFIQRSPSHVCCPWEIINSLSFHSHLYTLSLSNIPGLDNKLHVIFLIKVIDDFLAKEKETAKKHKLALQSFWSKMIQVTSATFHRLKSTPKFRVVRTYKCPQGEAANILNKTQPTKVNDGKHEDKMK